MDMAPNIASLYELALAALLGLQQVYRGCRDRERHPMFAPMTQTARYMRVSIGQAIIVIACALLPISYDTIWHDITRRFSGGVLSFAVAVLALAALASPVITLAALLYILRHPSEMAHGGSVEHSYCPTLWHRSASPCRYLKVTAKLDHEAGQGIQDRTEI